MEFTEKELRHEQVMSAVAKMCRSDKRGFTETEKLDSIRDLLIDSGYHEILLHGAQIWRKNFTSPIDIIVSSHADVVNSISKCSSELSDDGYYSGTYDNSGTTAAAVIAMLEGDIPDNVMFAFTADEETGRCMGAKQALEYARNFGYDPTCIALDVTYEGYDEGHLFTVENLSSGHKKNEDMDFLNDVAQSMMNLETEGKQSCHFVKISKNSIPSLLGSEYIAKDSGWFDEAQAYVNEHAKAFSLCLPCEGNMHSNRGVDVRQPVFEGYINALESMIYEMAKDPNREQYVEAKKTENAVLLDKTLEMVSKEQEEAKKSWKSNSNYYGGYYGSSVMSEDDYYDTMAYNASYGVYSGSSRNIDPEDYLDSPDYVDGFISDIIDGSYEYEPEEVMEFYNDAMAYISEEVIEYFGGLKGATRVILDIYNNSWGTHYAPDDFIDPGLLDEYEYDEETGIKPNPNSRIFVDDEELYGDDFNASKEYEEGVYDEDDDYEDEDRYSGYCDEL